MPVLRQGAAAGLLLELERLYHHIADIGRCATTSATGLAQARALISSANGCCA